MSKHDVEDAIKDRGEPPIGEDLVEKCNAPLSSLQPGGKGAVVWIKHESNSDSARYMKITNTVTMVSQPNYECDLNRIDLQPCPDHGGLHHVVFKKATTEKTLTITQDPAQDLQNDNSRTVGVGDASGLNTTVGLTPKTDARVFRLRYPGSTGNTGVQVLLELCQDHGKFLAYEGDRLQVLPHSGDVALAGTKFRFQIVSPDASDDSGSSADD